MSDDRTERVVAVNRGVEQSDDPAPSRGDAHRALDAWIGRWINQGHTIDEHGNAGLPITTSDVYEWAPGGFFVVHTAYGRIGDFGGGGVEVIGYDAASGEYVSHFFDSAGNRSTHRIVANGDTGPITARRPARRWSSARATPSRPCCTNAPTTDRRSFHRCGSR